jgi:ankyrin repeat protein
MRTDLATSIFELADATHSLTDSDLGQPFRWHAHREGVRFALLRVGHELRALAVSLAAKRQRFGLPITRAQHLLAQYHTAYRDLRAVILGVSDADYERPPAPGEWPLRYVYGHLVGVERNFFALVHYGLRRQREDSGPSPELPAGERERLFGPSSAFNDLLDSGSQGDMAAYHASIHDRVLSEFADITEAELKGPSVWWEGEPFDLQYRLHRFEAHMRQHTVQVEKSLDQLGRSPNETRRILRLIFAALAEVEGILIGAPNLAEVQLTAEAESIRALSGTIFAALGRASAMLSAVTGSDIAKVTELLGEDSQLANTLSSDGVPVARLAVYYGQLEIAEMLANSPEVELEIWEAAVLGRLELTKEIHNDWGDFIINDYSRDGYTPLQLACFFGREEVARYLVENGADVHAVSQNSMTIMPIHAAAAGNHNAIVRLLLEAGADSNATQQDGFRPLHAAAQNGNAELVRLMLDHKADPTLTTATGQTAADVAMAAGHGDIAALLS